MGFFTDADKKEEKYNNPNNFFNGEFDASNADSQNNTFFSKQGTSIQKVCRTDPKDNNFMICKIKEKKLVNENGQEKYITDEKEEREPISNNFFGFTKFFNSYNSNPFIDNDPDKVFFGFDKKNNDREEDPFKEFEESQYFMDFVPKIWTYFKGDPKQNKNKNLKHQNELQVDPFFDIMFPSIILRNIGLNDPFWNLSDGFSRNQYNHQNLQNKMPNNFNQSPNQSNLNSYNNYANFNNSQNNYQKPTQKNNKDNDKYQYFNYGANNKNSDDIYDL